MKKHASFFYVLTLFNYLIFAQDVYQSIRVYDPTSETMEVIGNLGVPLDHITGKPGVFVDLTVKDDDTIELLSRGIDLEILISDLTLHYRSRNQSAISRDFPLGSMQGNYTWDELNTRFDELQNAYPNIICLLYTSPSPRD